MSTSQVPKKVVKELPKCLDKDENSVKDGLQCKSKSKRRRTRRKNKLATTNSNLSEQELQNLRKTAGICQVEPQTTDCEVDDRLKTPATESCTEIECNKLPVISPSETLTEEMDNKNGSAIKNKNEIKAKRQEKKQIKLAIKLKYKSKKDENQVSTEQGQQLLQKTKDNSEKPSEDLEIVANSEMKSLNKTSEKLDGTTGNEDLEKAPTVKHLPNKSNTTGELKKDAQRKPEITEAARKTEKSREEIMAEREARKQAKLNAKLKTKSANNDKDTKPSEVLPVNARNLEETLVDRSLDEKAAGKSKAELRAERRAKQEAQRAAKEAEKRSKLDQQTNNQLPSQIKKKTEIISENKVQKEKIMPIPIKTGHQRVKLFSHLKFEQKTSEAKLVPNVHPEIVKLGMKYSSRVVMGSNARCVALLNALKEVIMDYITPSEKEFSRGLESQLSYIMAYLNKCRPSSVSMTNAVRHIKSHLTQLPNDIADVEARRKLCDVIDTYIREQIDVAGEAICNSVQEKIANGDNILIYGCSSLLFRILVESHKAGKQFTVVVVDSGPWFEGREMLRRLVDHGIKCSYVLISALSFIMREVTKILLGAHALLANGSVMSRTGSALVALVASSYNVPVLVCCETYKFCERVQMDAFVYNELGNDEDMDYSRAVEMKENDSTVAMLSVLYDITPADLVTAVVTELAILPCTSVPVILRIRPSDVVT
ncbi:eukaryotic translation initiation factor 2B subunit delta isoform X1 [Rhodnius prolixus]